MNRIYRDCGNGDWIGNRHRAPSYTPCMSSSNRRSGFPKGSRGFCRQRSRSKLVQSKIQIIGNEDISAVMEIYNTCMYVQRLWEREWRLGVGGECGEAPPVGKRSWSNTVQALNSHYGQCATPGRERSGVLIISREFVETRGRREWKRRGLNMGKGLRHRNALSIYEHRSACIHLLYLL